MSFELEDATSELELTPHAVTRFAQRGFCDGDAELIVAIGTEVRGGYFVRQKDVQGIERNMKRFLKQVRRLSGKRLVIEGNAVVTGYHAKPGKERKLLKKLKSG